MLDILKRRWFLIVLLATLVSGALGAPQLADFADAFPKNGVIAIVLFVMALPLKTETVYQAIRRPGPALLGVAVNMMLLPILAFGASQLLPYDLALGTIVAATVPCTLASAAVWTRLAGGNDAISMMVTVITNVGCFAATPAWLSVLAGQGGTEIAFGEMSQKLLLLVVAPMVAAQLLRLLPAVARFADRHQPRLSLFAQVGVLSIVLLGAIHCGNQLRALEAELARMGWQLVLMLVLLATMHLVAWAAGFLSAGKLGFGRAEQIAVGFAGSQKTLMVGLAIALEYGGLAILPMLAYHIEQLLIDTVLADLLRTTEVTEPPKD